MLRTVSCAVLGSLLVFSRAKLAGAAPLVVDLAAGDQDATFVGADVRDRMGGLDLDTVTTGDLNGDGWPDVVFTSLWGDGPVNGRPDCGEVAIAFGPFARGLNRDFRTDPPDALVYGPQSLISIGTALSTGDLNRDGIDDLVLGAPLASPLGPLYGEGAVYVLFGPLGARAYDLATDWDVRVYGAAGSEDSAPADSLGWMSTAVGDLTGDGVNDLVMNASRDRTRFPTRMPSPGVVHVLAGPFTTGTTVLLADTPAYLSVYGARADDRLGFSLAVADVSGDGRADLIVGAPYVDEPPGRSDAGAVYVLRGPFPAPRTIDLAVEPADLVIHGPSAGDRLGSDIAVGDLDGDRVLDLVAGAELAHRSPVSVPGAAFILHGPLTAGDIDLASASHSVVWGETSGDAFGSFLAVADATGDGRDDLIGAGYRSRGPAGSRPDAGTVFVVNGPLGRTVTRELATDPPDAYVYGATPGDSLANARGAVADFRHIGRASILLAAHEASGPSDARTQCGEGYLVTLSQASICATLPGPVTQLLAVRAGDDVAMVWDVPPPPADLSNVWKVVDRDKHKIPHANASRSLTDPAIASACAAVPVASSACRDLSVVSAQPALLFYQVRAACADGVEGIDHPF